VVGRVVDIANTLVAAEVNVTVIGTVMVIVGQATVLLS